MRHKIAFLLKLIYLIVFITWFFKVYEYYFGLSLPTRVVTVAIACGFSILYYRIQRGIAPLFMISVTTPLVLFPSAGWLVSEITGSWILVFSLLLIALLCLTYVHSLSSLLVSVASLLVVFFLPYERFPDQYRFKDRLTASENTGKGLAHVTRWKSDFWVYYNHKLQFSTIDRHVLSESFVYPAMHLAKKPEKILILGGDDGIVLDGLSAFESPKTIKIIPKDPGFFEFVRKEIKVSSTQGVEKIQDDPVDYLRHSLETFDIIFIDFEDAAMLDTEFYKYCKERVNQNGYIVMHTGDYFKDNRVFWTLNMFKRVDFNAVSYHMQVPTLGEASWVIAAKNDFDPLAIDRSQVPSEWWTPEVQRLLFNEGKVAFVDAVFQ